MTPAALVVMARRPDPGRAKTRLVPALGAAGAASLYAAMIADRLAGVTALAADEGARAYVAVAPDGAADWFARRAPGVAPLTQRGRTLGARLADVFARLLARGHPAVLAVDSDSPTLPRAHLAAALARLASGTCDVVVGPTDDGGYYAIGLRAPHPALFDVEMSTPRVLADTLARAAALDLSVACLPGWYDVDDGPDVERLARDLAAGAGDDAPATRAWLARQGRLAGAEAPAGPPRGAPDDAP